MKKYFAILLLIAASTAHASILELDLYATGDQLITRDTESGLEWLDISAATGISISQLTTHGLSVTHGFRIATFGELEDLYIRAGATSAHGVITNSPSSLNLANFHGWSDTGPTPFLEEAGLSIGSPISPSPDLIVGLTYYDGNLTATVSPMSAYQSQFESSPQSLSLVLVRDITAVPLPASLWLTLSGILGLASISKRK